MPQIGASKYQKVLLNNPYKLYNISNILHGCLKLVPQIGASKIDKGLKEVWDIFGLTVVFLGIKPLNSVFYAEFKNVNIN